MTLQSLPAKHVYQMRQPHQSCRAYIETARRHFLRRVFFLSAALPTENPEIRLDDFERLIRANTCFKRRLRATRSGVV